MITVVHVTESRIPDFVFARVQIRDRPRARFVRPVAPFILPHKMVIIGLVDDECNLRRARRALGFKGGHPNVGIISQNTRHHIRARLGARLLKALVSSRRSWLMKRGVAELLPFAVGHLFRIVHIHRIGKAVVRVCDLRVAIPKVRIVFGFPS